MSRQISGGGNGLRNTSMGTATTTPEMPRAFPVQRAVKRAVDILVAGVALVVFAPLMIAEAIVIWISMGRPIFFRQVRPGKNEQLFEVVKFRTMLPEHDWSGRPLTEAERVTRLGWFLRRTSLDELPQLWSVIKGELSLVGPRPLLRAYLPYYTERERLRHTVPPGVTGLAQVNGRNRITWDKRLELDVQYVEQWSIWLDFKIILKTFAFVFKTEGVDRDPDQEGALNTLRGGHGAVMDHATSGSSVLVSVVEIPAAPAPHQVKARGS